MSRCMSAPAPPLPPILERSASPQSSITPLTDVDPTPGGGVRFRGAARHLRPPPPPPVARSMSRCMSAPAPPLPPILERPASPQSSITPLTDVDPTPGGGGRFRGAAHHLRPPPHRRRSPAPCPGAPLTDVDPTPAGGGRFRGAARHL